MTTVAPGVHWVRMPLPFTLDHVNLWLIEDGAGWTVVDAGIDDDRTHALWRAVLDGPAAGRPVRRLIVTHFHPDHLGSAGWLQEVTGAPLWMPRAEWLTGRWLVEAGDEVGRRQADFLRDHGLPTATVETLGRLGNRYRARVGAVPSSYRRIVDGDLVEIGGRPWHVATGEGHAPEQAALRCPDLGLLIAGDQVLPRITPNISTQWYEPEADPLADFFRALDRLRDLPDDTLTLPSHDRPFRGLHVRVAALRRHHAARLDAVLAACGQPSTAFDILEVLFRRPLDDHQIVFAMGEAVAHLVHLERAGSVRRARKDRVWRFRRA